MMNRKLISILICTLLVFNGNVLAENDEMNKIDLLRKLISKTEDTLGLKTIKRPISLEASSIDQPMKESWAPLGTPKEEKIVIYNNSISYFWVYSEPGNPYHWDRYNSVANFLTGYFKDPIRIKALKIGREYSNMASIETHRATSKKTQEEEQKAKIYLQNKLSEIAKSKLALKLEKAVFN